MIRMTGNVAILEKQTELFVHSKRKTMRQLEQTEGMRSNDSKVISRKLQKVQGLSMYKNKIKLQKDT